MKNNLVALGVAFLTSEPWSSEERELQRRVDEERERDERLLESSLDTATWLVMPGMRWRS